MPMRWVERCAHRAEHLSRYTKATVAITADAVVIPLLLFSAVGLRRASLAGALQVSPWLYITATVGALAIFVSLGMYRVVFRFVSPRSVFTATLGALGTTALVATVNGLFIRPSVSLSATAIFGALLLLYMLLSRAAVRELLSYRHGAKQRVVIYGAGQTGAQLALALRESGQYQPVAFVDADTALHGRQVAAIKVFPPSRLPALVRRESVTSVLLAIPSCSRRERQRILKSLEHLPVHVRTVPDISDIVAGRANVDDVRDVDAYDLLGREPVAPNRLLLNDSVRDKVVMVSGAGGSIGSEICRQIVPLGPKRLVLLEISEVALYQIERELRMMTADRGELEIVALLGSAHHLNRMREIMRTYQVQTVYHAAAYKHVPIVEHNTIAGIHNNVFGTLHSAQAALDSGVETFVLISTDKAVNPTNVMGATKRFAELILQAMQERSTSTRFCMVRFGNVLKSSGSVVPLFREQIKRGGPVTVTHKDVTRYFMTIPEASQLVLQAGSMARGGEVFVLNMGEPVRIADLARRMIRLMGATVRDADNPDGEIEIVYTGLRPAEKLYEELLIGKNVTGTEHPMIMCAIEHHIPWPKLKPILDELQAAIESLDCIRARELLLSTVTEYRPVGEIQDLVWSRRREGQPGFLGVTNIRSRLARLPDSSAVDERLIPSESGGA